MYSVLYAVYDVLGTQTCKLAIDHDSKLIAEQASLIHHYEDSRSAFIPSLQSSVLQIRTARMMQVRVEVT